MSSKNIEYLDPSELTLSDGIFLVRLARKAISEYLKKGIVIKPPENTPDKLMRYGMSFTTLLKVDAKAHELRGCIGYVQPIESLVNNVINSAIAAATQDPRFSPVEFWELESIVIEVSILSLPKVLEVSRRDDMVNEVVVGRDGLIVEYGIYKGLLLPEVPVEYCWDTETFLSETCIKAGMSADCWLSSKVKVMRFTARTFREVSPGGDVIERDLSKEFIEQCRFLRISEVKS